MSEIMNPESALEYVILNMIIQNKTHLRFPSGNLKESIDALQLSARSYNCLRRANIQIVDDLYGNGGAIIKLDNIRNLGKKSKNEIYRKLFQFQYEQVKNIEKKAYLDQCIAMSV